MTEAQNKKWTKRCWIASAILFFMILVALGAMPPSASIKQCDFSEAASSYGDGVKKDILGFSLGMSEKEFKDRGGNNCSRLLASTNKSLEVEFTTQFNQKIIKEIKFRFRSGTSPADMISQVTEQFKIKPIKSNWQTEIRWAESTRPCKGPLFPFCVGGLIAEWQTDDMSLKLTLNDPAFESHPNDYILTLSSKAIMRLERQAEQDRVKEQEMRAREINPTQRF